MHLKDLLDNYLAIAKRFIPEHTVKPTVGLDISASVCKMVELQAQGNGFQLLNYGIEPVSNNDYKTAIKNLLAKLSSPATSVVTAIYGKGTLVRYLDMPRMGIEELRKSFAFEVDKYFPFPKDQIYTDCHILAAKEKENKMLVLAAAAKREMIAQRMEILKAVGLEADFITLNAMAISNLFNAVSAIKGAANHPEADKPAAVAVLDMGERVSNLVILVNGEPRFTRDIFIGGNEVTSCICNGLGLDVKTAEELKRNPQDRQEELLHACESMLLNLTSEIRLSFDYFLTEKNIPIQEMLLTGGGSLLAGLPELVGKQLELNARSWQLFENMTLSAKLSAAEVKKNGSRLSVALGLALVSV